jgi:hypothetical protein
MYSLYSSIQNKTKKICYQYSLFNVYLMNKASTTRIKIKTGILKMAKIRVFLGMYNIICVKLNIVLAK